MKTVSIRVDRSIEVGMGHWYRCQALARALLDLGVKATWLVNGWGKMPKNKVLITDLSHDYSLININQHVDYLKALVKVGCRIIMIDGIYHDSVSQRLKVPVAVLVVPYLGAEKWNYLVTTETKLLLGPAYAILRENFIKLRRVRRVKEKAEKILVTLGGSDRWRGLNKIVKALKQLGWPGLQFKVIAKGSQASGKEMARLMNWADMGILGSGLTRYEAALMGLPSLIVGADKKVDRLMREFAKHGTAIYLGNEIEVTQHDIVKAVTQLLDNRDLRQKMADRGQALVDGKGAYRVAKEIIRQL